MSDFLIRPLDVRTYDLDFSDVSEIVNADALVSATATVDDDTLILGTPSVQGNSVMLSASGGIAGRTYEVIVVASFGSGSKFEAVISFFCEGPP